MKFTTWVGSIAIIVLACEGAVFAMNSAYPSCPAGERIRMPMPFAHNGGLSYVTSIPVLALLGDNVGEKESPVVICENHRTLGPAHTRHREIAELGRGRFSHWGAELVFSTSDNSDPNTNGRSYLAVRTDRP
jgi:hypothetical protein